MKKFNICLAVIAVLCTGLFMVPAWSDMYDAPPTPVNPSSEMKACYNALTTCMDECDRMYPAPYPSQPNAFFEGCVKNCNKVANLCIAEVNR